MIKNIVLDMGNVLLDYDPEVSLKKYCSSEEEADVIRRELFDGPEWEMADRGDICDAERFDLVKVRVTEQYHEALRNCVDHWDICMKPLPGAKEFCEYVKENGYGIYVLSNASDRFYQYFGNFAPISYFDGVFVSSDYKMLKPDSIIYSTFLEKYGLTAEECLFVDDRQKNVTGAWNADIPAIRFRGDFGEIRRFVEAGGFHMQFKRGLGWKACYDADQNLYTAQRSWRGFYQLCEIDREIFDILGTEAMGEESEGAWIGKGRHLLEADDDYYTMPYCTVYDEDYLKLAPWSYAYMRDDEKIRVSRQTVDFEVENFASEEKNRAYRKKKEEEKANGSRRE